MSCGSGEYVRLMEHYPLVNGQFLSAVGSRVAALFARRIWHVGLMEHYPLATG